MVATIHDLLVTLAFLAFFRYDLTLNVIAAILTVTGYSTNDTIVIFDRVRENLRGMRRDSLNDVINVSINQTLGRTVLTAGTALLSAIALFLFGGEVLRGFAFTMIVGIITGTYSSVFVAAAIVTFWRGQGPTRARARMHRRRPVRRRRRAAAADAQAEAAAQGARVVVAGSGFRLRLRRPMRDRPEAGLAEASSCPPSFKPHCSGSCRGSPSSCPSPQRPISSSASGCSGFRDPGSVFTEMIQLGSILAIMWLYRAKILEVVAGLPTRREARRFALVLFIAFLPAAVAGALASDFVETRAAQEHSGDRRGVHAGRDRDAGGRAVRAARDGAECRRCQRDAGARHRSVPDAGA